MSVPAFAPFLLAHYDDAKESSDTQLLSLEAMQSNAAPEEPTPLPPPTSNDH